MGLDLFERLVVATDAPEVVEVVEAFGGKAVLTREDHASGTDRVGEVATRPEFERMGPLVNLQGDEPFLAPGAVEAALGLLDGDHDIGTIATPITDRQEYMEPAVVKVIRDDAGRALYFSRAAVPYSGTGGPEPDGDPGLYLRHVGLYAFRRQALLRATALPRHPLEELERLEQLRWLAAGFRIGVAIVEGGEPGVDTEEDLVRAEAILKRRRRKFR